jgi:hypothetical protein
MSGVGGRAERVEKVDNNLDKRCLGWFSGHVEGAQLGIADVAVRSKAKGVSSRVLWSE